MIRRVKRVRRGTLGRRWGHPRRSASRAVLFGVPFDFFGVVEKESAVLERVEIYAVPPLTECSAIPRRFATSRRVIRALPSVSDATSGSIGDRFRAKFTGHDEE